MTVLVFFDRGYTVATSGWTAAARPKHGVVVCYTWGADGVSWAYSATGVAQVDLPMTMDEFLLRIREQHEVDFRADQTNR